MFYSAPELRFLEKQMIWFTHYMLTSTFCSDVKNQNYTTASHTRGYFCVLWCFFFFLLFFYCRKSVDRRAKFLRNPPPPLISSVGSNKRSVFLWGLTRIDENHPCYLLEGYFHIQCIQISAAALHLYNYIYIDIYIYIEREREIDVYIHTHIYI